MKITHSLLFLIFVLPGAAHADKAPVVTSELPGAVVTVTFPASQFEVGDKKPFKVKVETVDGREPPDTVRARLGMPYMHHWVTDEQAQPYSADGAEFISNIAMPGVFRFRVWLDFADGSGATTAIDFKVMSGEDLDPEVVQE